MQLVWTRSRVERWLGGRCSFSTSRPGITGIKACACLCVTGFSSAESGWLPQSQSMIDHGGVAQTTSELRPSDNSQDSGKGDSGKRRHSRLGKGDIQEWRYGIRANWIYTWDFRAPGASRHHGVSTRPWMHTGGPRCLNGFLTLPLAGWPRQLPSCLGAEGTRGLTILHNSP